MMNKLIVLVLALAIVAPALADDVVIPWWADDGLGNRVGPTGQDPCDPARWTGPEQLQGSTFSEWTYDVDTGDPFFPDDSYFVSHPLKEDPWHEIGGEPFSGQWWVESDPCAGPVWSDTKPYSGTRQGHLNFLGASWDVQNFIHDQPAKDMQIQITYFNGTAEASGVDYAEAGYFGMVDGDPCAVPMAGYEGNLADWPTDPCFPDPMYTWEGDEGPYGVCELELTAWDPCWPDPIETWDNSYDHMEWSFMDAERTVAGQDLGDGWLLDVFYLELGVNPEMEYFEIFYLEGIQVDQVVIDTLCYVPEPATMALLGLGSLLMIRRKKVRKFR